MPTFTSRLATERAWVDPYALPKYMDASDVSGNAPHDVKQLTLNTLGAYGVGKEDCFAHIVGRRIHITEMDIDQKGDKAEVTVIAEVQASREMLNGAGTVHGGCLCYLIDNCASFPLVALGILRNVNGVGVTQSMNIFFHAPASLQTIMQIKSVSVTLGGRIMTSRCEITDKQSGRMIASALLGKMQPAGATKETSAPSKTCQDSESRSPPASASPTYSPPLTPAVPLSMQAKAKL
ncbi:HotDog domain-containing protein [Earliella scabrosa]|nr:HotDog domain-containing protein [Earliella scabrosa]